MRRARVRAVRRKHANVARRGEEKEPTRVDPALLGLQRAAGNRAVTGMLSRSAAHTAGADAAPHESYSISVSIPAVRKAADSMPGQEKELTLPVPATQPSAPVTPATDESEAEGGIALPDIDPGLVVKTSDAVAGTLGYSASIKRDAKAGLEAGDFGITNWGGIKVSGIKVTRAGSKFMVTATAEQPILYDVRSGKGPDDQVDIGSDSDPDITKTNYPNVVASLTPDPTDKGGRPPRLQFWAEDLTIIHEEFHAKDVKKYAPAAAKVAETWLATQTAASIAEVSTLLESVPHKMVEALDASYAPKSEDRAYAYGSASYAKRAKAIDRKGKAGKYP
jgi:hypothetical protein